MPPPPASDEPAPTPSPGGLRPRGIDLPPGFTAWSLAGLAAGIGLGVVAHHTGSERLLWVASTLEPVGTLWTDALRMMVVPLVVSFLIVAVAGYGDPRESGRLGGTALLVHLGLLVVGAALALGAVFPVLDRFALDAGTVAAFRQSAAAAPELEAARSGGPDGISSWITYLVPDNPVGAAAGGELLPLIVFTAVFGAAVSAVDPDRRQTVVAFFRGVADASLVGVGWLLWLLPVAVFALTLPLASRAGLGAVGALGFYIVLVCLLLAVLTAGLYPITAIGAGIPIGRFARGMAPAQAVAVASRSSLATLPALLEAAVSKFSIPRRAAGLVLPLSASAFRLNRTVSSPTKFLFVAHMYGVSVDPGFLAFYVGSIFFLSFTSPGIPSGGFGLSLPFYIAAGLPVEGYVLMRTIDAIPDVFKTVLNVTGDMTVTAVADRHGRGGT